MVRGFRGGVDDLSRVFPVSAAVPLRLCRPDDAQARAAEAGYAARYFARGKPPIVAHHPGCELETCGGRRPDLAHPRIAHRHDRTALLFALDHRSAGTSVVRAHLSGGHGVPPLRAVQFRFAPRAYRLSVRRRTVDRHGAPVLDLERGLWAVRAAVRMLRDL